VGHKLKQRFEGVLVERELRLREFMPYPVGKLILEEFEEGLAARGGNGFFDGLVQRKPFGLEKEYGLFGRRSAVAHEGVDVCFLAYLLRIAKLHDDPW